VRVEVAEVGSGPVGAIENSEKVWQQVDEHQRPVADGRRGRIGTRQDTGDPSPQQDRDASGIEVVAAVEEAEVSVSCGTEIPYPFRKTLKAGL
jgi:hypothetical protein